MNPLVALALELQDYFEAREWRFCFIGGFALQHWGEPRMTKDVDVSLLTGFGNEEVFIEPLIRDYIPRIENLREFALQRRVMLLQTQEGMSFDISFGAIPFEESAVQRSVKVEYAEGVYLRICGAEDLVVYKAFASRPRDWEDVKTILIRQEQKLDWKYIESSLTPLCEIKEDLEIVPRLLKLKSELEES